MLIPYNALHHNWHLTTGSAQLPNTTMLRKPRVH